MNIWTTKLLVTEKVFHLVIGECLAFAWLRSYNQMKFLVPL